MHILEPKHIKLKKEEIDTLVSKFNISLIQLPKMKITDPALPENSNIGDVIRIERKSEDGKIVVYYRFISI